METVPSTMVANTESTIEIFSVISNNHNSSLTTTQSTLTDLYTNIGTTITNVWTLDSPTTITGSSINLRFRC